MITDLTPPATEPMDAADALLRAQLRLDAAETEEDAFLTALCASARAQVEDMTGQRLITQEVRLTLPGFPSKTGRIPVAPVQAIEAVRYTDTGGTLTTLDAADYRLLQTGPLWSVRPPLGGSWPGLHPEGEVQIDLTVGFGNASDIPAPLMQAMRLLVATGNRYREAVEDGQRYEVPLTVREMLARWRVFA